MNDERQIATYRDQRKHRKLIGQVTAVKWLHANVDGFCAHCGYPSPCPTREVLALGSNTGSAPARLRDQAWQNLRAKIAEILGVTALSTTTTTEGNQ